ncbi:MAG: c-type cytochrome [Bacteroidetes bacterium]|nr:c-type cytochrome [Bacteroidota bacterium]
MNVNMRGIVGILCVLGLLYGASISCQTNTPKNLKVLRDRDMTVEEVKEYMRSFTLSLGVECEYCHDTDDYASDKLKEKEAARQMIKMVYAMNDAYFKNSREEITCYTCHRGQVETKSIPPGL